MKRPLQRAIGIVALLPFLALALACRSGTPPIVFTSDRDGNLEVYSVRADGRGTEENLTKSPRNEFSPALSPNGRHIAFLSGEGSDMSIEVLRISGEERTAVFSGGGEITQPKWDPDSDRLAYAVKQDSGKAVYVSDSEGEESVLLSKVSADEVGGWSPEGDFVVFSVREGGEQGIYIRNPDGVNEFRRTQSTDYGATWSPDSRFIAFLSTRDGNPEIYVIDPEGGEEIRVTDSEAPEYDLSWSPNGKRLLFVTERDGNAEIYSVEIEDGGMSDNLTRLTHNEVRDEQPTWSPNGRRIAFVSNLDGDAEIFVMESDGQNQQRLTNNQFQDTEPSW
ncbi:MAG: LpqB family beta-propeller domain-containing protein [Chloroflexi bacterium]|nr:LpqB family beta-propeller domain-containing protein [Chloroflexota bacterium]